MEGANAIAALFANIDSMGKDFTAATYGTFAAYLTPALAGLLVLYLIFWGFQFWQGRGDTNLMTMVFKLLRIAVIFALATQWGPFQLAAAKAINSAPYLASAVMLNKIVNPRDGKAMSLGTPARDLADIYGFALKASIKIEKAAKDDAAVAAPVPAPQAGKEAAPAKPKPSIVLKDPQDPLSVVLSSAFQAALVWIAAALFVGYAAALLLFAKITLWILLALAPIFITLLMFQISSRFFSGWLTGILQVALIPIFLSTFLSFYIFGTYDVIFALRGTTLEDGVPTMKEVGPFVLVCFIGLFVLVQIVPLTGRIATAGQEWFTNAYERANSSVRERMNAGANARGKGKLGSSGGISETAAQGQFAATNAMETSLREIQDRNAAQNRQNRNR